MVDVISSNFGEEDIKNKYYAQQFYEANGELLSKFSKTRNVTIKTEKGYEVALINYVKFHNDITLSDLIDEALKEEDLMIPQRNRKIKIRLESFREYLVDAHKCGSTIRTYLNRVKTFYRHFGVEIPELSKIKLPKTEEVGYFDLPDKEMIQTAVRQADNKFKALIVFMASSGTAKRETLSISVGMFLDACKEYVTDTNNIGQSINELWGQRHNVVPIFRLKRFKTDKWYYTCCTPEAVEYILNHLMCSFNLTRDSKLFDYTDSGLLGRFQDINDSNSWGWVGKYRKFRSHMLRKFHASNIGLPAELVDALQGRSKNQIHNTYIKNDPRKLRDAYCKVMHNVFIFDGVNVGGLPVEDHVSDVGVSNDNMVESIDVLDNVDSDSNLIVNNINIKGKNDNGTLNVDLLLNVNINPNRVSDLFKLMNNDVNSNTDNNVVGSDVDGLEFF